jgi:hypothetical protein
MSSPNTVVSRSITAQNQFTDAMRIGNRKFSISISATALTGTVTLQRKLAGEADSAYRDVEQWTAKAEKIGESVGVWDYRIGIKTGDFSAATGLVVALVV